MIRKIPISFTLPPDITEKIDALRGELTRSLWVLKTLCEKFQAVENRAKSEDRAIESDLQRDESC